MKISLGVDFNSVRTIVSYFDEQNKISKILYNQLSIGLLPKLLGTGSSYFGEECFRFKNVPNNLNFIHSFNSQDLKNKKKYLLYVFRQALDNLKVPNYEVEYVIFAESTNNDSSGAIKKIMSEVFAEIPELRNAKINFIPRRDALNFALVKSLNQVGKIEENNFIVINLSDCVYEASSFSYKKGDLAPSQSYISCMKQYFPSIEDSIGLRGFCKVMLKSALNHNKSAEVKALLIDDEFSLPMIKAVDQLETFLDEYPSHFYLKDSYCLCYVDNDKKLPPITVTKKDYDVAVEQVIYQSSDFTSIRKFLKELKDEIKDQLSNPINPIRIILYGKIIKNIDVIGVIHSIFGFNTIVTYDLIFPMIMNEIKDLNHVAHGAAYQSSLRYKGTLPDVYYIDFENEKKKLWQKYDNLLLSQTKNNTPMYTKNEELFMPLEYILPKSFKMPFIIKEKEFDLVDYLYEDGYLSGVIRKENFGRIDPYFLCNLRIGIQYDNHRFKVIFEFSSNQNGFYNEFYLEVEE